MNDEVPSRDEDPELLGLLTLMTGILRDFADVADAHIDEGIDAALAQISDFTGVDRSYLFLTNESDPQLIDNTHEWCAPGISPEIDNLQGVPLEVIHGWLPPFSRGEPVYVPVVDELPDSRADERELLQSQGIQSLVVVPLKGPEGFRGFLGFDSVRRHRDWSDGAILLLRAVADVILGGLMRHRAYLALKHIADHDSLTQLATRKVLMERLEVALERGRKSPRVLGVLFVDVDHFKDVNDSLGHREGDRLLGQVARRLEGVRGQGDTVARFGGDEFVLLLDDDDHDEETIRWRAKKVLTVFEELFEVGGRPTRITASAGLVVTSEQAKAEDLLRDADAAMYFAKESGRDRIEVFDMPLRDALLRRVETASDLEGCQDRGELHLVYQPQYCLRTGEFFGVEALVRWDHPEHGWVSPGDFIPVAEETGQIVPIGAWVLSEAMRQMAVWRAGHPDCPSFKVSVNLSARQLTHNDLVAQVGRSIEAHGIDPADVCLELTESALMEEGDAGRATLDALRALGVTLSIDDFGTGYSSLAYLRNLPVRYLKIDRAFVDQMEASEQDQNVVRAIVSLARSFEMITVAEGVENEEQLRRLGELGVDLAQGFYLMRPVAPEKIERLWCQANSV